MCRSRVLESEWVSECVIINVKWIISNQSSYDELGDSFDADFVWNTSVSCTVISSKYSLFSLDLFILSNFWISILLLLLQFPRRRRTQPKIIRFKSNNSTNIQNHSKISHIWDRGNEKRETRRFVQKQSQPNAQYEYWNFWMRAANIISARERNI